MIRRRRHPAATQRTTRLEAFTDGVFAIAATLLVLDLTSHALGEVTTDAALWAALAEMWPLFATFVLSFVLLCLLWMTHVQQFEHIQRVDSVIVWLNSFRLLFVVLVPFATSLTTDHSALLAGRLAMPITFFGAILFGALQSAWARRHRAEFMPDMTADEVDRAGQAAFSAVVLSAAVVALAPFIGSIGFLLFALDPLLTRLLGRRRAG